MDVRLVNTQSARYCLRKIAQDRNKQVLTQSLISLTGGEENRHTPFCLFYVRSRFCVSRGRHLSGDRETPKKSTEIPTRACSLHSQTPTFYLLVGCEPLPQAKHSRFFLTDLSLDSIHDRIKKTLPEALWPLLPLDPTPVCPYLDGGAGIPASLQRIAGEIDTQFIMSNEPVAPVVY